MTAPSFARNFGANWTRLWVIHFFSQGLFI